jgi:hypothetical protein
MRNTYNISLLRKRIVDALPRPASPFGESAIEGFLSLPGASAWRPDRVGLRELSFVFDVGVPLALIGDNPSIRPIALEIGDAARDGRQPDKTLRGLVHAAALLSRWGCAIQFMAGEAAVRRTWRIEVAQSGGEPVDVVMVDAARDAIATDRLQLLVREVDGGLEDTATSFDDAFAQSREVCGALVFQPRFWIGVEQKEWLHLARLNPSARVALQSDRLGGADGERRALRLPLLV